MGSELRPSLLPHRPPFLFVDEVVAADEKRIVTRWTARADADFFRGHYPGRPIVPAVLLCECCFQAGALLLIHILGGVRGGQGEIANPGPKPISVEAFPLLTEQWHTEEGGHRDRDLSTSVPLITRIGDARFKRMVLPGQSVEIEVTLDDTLDQAYFLTGRAAVEGQLAARVSFVCTLGRPGGEAP